MRAIGHAALILTTMLATLGAEVQCQQAEARPSLDDLQTQVDELRSFVEKVPLVVDSANNEVGVVIGGQFESASRPFVQIDQPGLPLFVLTVRGGELLTEHDERVYFESEDCTGVSWLEATVNPTWGAVGLVIDDADRLFYVSDPESAAQSVFLRSSFRSDGFCDTTLDQTLSVRQGVIVDLDAMFSGPFRVTTYEEFSSP